MHVYVSVYMDSEYYSMTRQRKPNLPFFYGYPVPSYGYLPRSGQMLTASWAQGANGFFPPNICYAVYICIYVCVQRIAGGSLGSCHSRISAYHIQQISDTNHRFDHWL